MNIYIMQKYLQFFLKKLKENDNIDDFILDKTYFGKQKIRIVSKKDKYDVFESLVSILPTESVIVCQKENPGKEYLLCVGELPFSEISFLKKHHLELTILTIKENKVRFNSWVHCSKIQELYQTNTIQQFSSVSGKIEASCYFVFETENELVNRLIKEISVLSSEFIIKEKQIYVKLLLKDFTNHFEQLKPFYTILHIVDKEGDIS